ncbi:MAG: DUF4418 family protein [Thermoleophilia bacterium]
MKKSSQIATGAGVAALGALVALTPRYIFPVCEYFGVRMEMGSGSVPMSCYYTSRGSLLAGLLIVLIGIAITTARPAALQSLALVLAGAGLGVFLIPTFLFPVCHNPEMHCNNGTKPMLLVLGIVIMIMAGWTAYGSRSNAPLIREMRHETGS